jgi:arsenate reductase
MAEIAPENDSALLRRKPHVLFVGQHDGTYTQIALGYMDALGSGMLETQSGGIQSHAIDPRVTRAMSEDGVDIRRHHASLVTGQQLRWADLVIVIGTMDEDIRVAVPGSAHQKRWSIRQGLGENSPEAGPEVYKTCRDEIKQRVQGMLQAIRLFKVA